MHALNKCQWLIEIVKRTHITVPDTLKRSSNGKETDFRMVEKLLVITISGEWRICVPGNCWCKQCAV